MHCTRVFVSVCVCVCVYVCVYVCVCVVCGVCVWCVLCVCMCVGCVLLYTSCGDLVILVPRRLSPIVQYSDLISSAPLIIRLAHL